MVFLTDPNENPELEPASAGASDLPEEEVAPATAEEQASEESPSNPAPEGDAPDPGETPPEESPAEVGPPPEEAPAEEGASAGEAPGPAPDRLGLVSVAAAPEVPVEAEVHEGPAQEAEAGMLIAQQQDSLTCGVCNQAIKPNSGYVRAAYGSVHYTDCRHRSRPLRRGQ
jgi:hypothetical protein